MDDIQAIKDLMNAISVKDGGAMYPSGMLPENSVPNLLPDPLTLGHYLACAFTEKIVKALATDQDVIFPVPEQAGMNNLIPVIGFGQREDDYAFTALGAVKCGSFYADPASNKQDTGAEANYIGTELQAASTTMDDNTGSRFDSGVQATIPATTNREIAYSRTAGWQDFNHGIYDYGEDMSANLVGDMLDWQRAWARLGYVAEKDWPSGCNNLYDEIPVDWRHYMPANDLLFNYATLLATAMGIPVQ
jgi:hypothetical protein